MCILDKGGLLNNLFHKPCGLKNQAVMAKAEHSHCAPKYLCMDFFQRCDCIMFSHKLMKYLKQIFKLETCRGSNAQVSVSKLSGHMPVEWLHDHFTALSQVQCYANRSVKWEGFSLLS